MNLEGRLKMNTNIIHSSQQIFIDSDTKPTIGLHTAGYKSSLTLRLGVSSYPSLETKFLEAWLSGRLVPGQPERAHFSVRSVVASHCLQLLEVEDS